MRIFRCIEGLFVVYQRMARLTANAEKGPKEPLTRQNSLTLARFTLILFVNRPSRIVFFLCAAEILSMAGTMYFPALQPVFEAQWQLSGTAAGWINGVFFTGYAAATPLLVSLTDRMDPRRIYIPSVLLSALSMFLFAAFAHGTASAALLRLIGGIGLAGTYMPGLRSLSDNVGGTRQSRYVSFYTASFAF